MKLFLESLAKYTIDHHSQDLDELCILFPNRRAGLFFKKYFSSLKSEAGWFPEILTIGDFMNRISGLEPADPLELSFQIYRVYQNITNTDESLDEFYPWGEIMIRDFDDIDKYLVNAEQLYTNIQDLKELDNVFDYLEPEQKKLISKFWNSFDINALSSEKELFLGLWKVFLPVYRELRKSLFEKGMGYEGMIYRQVAEEKIPDPAFQWPWKKILICGFNALSESEKKLFSHLRDTGIGEFYWDYDFMYLDDKVHEAGRFIRENLKSFPPEKDFNPGFRNLYGQKDIQVVSLPSDVLQAKELHGILQHESQNSLNEGLFTAENSPEFNSTAVILGDETLLPSVLLSLPEHVSKFNITMGFPVSQTPVFSFVEAILRMQQNFLRRRNHQKFYYRDILSILNHQYIKSFYSSKAEVYIERINRYNKIYLAADEFLEDPLFKDIFRKVETVPEILKYLEIVFTSIISEFPVDSEAFRLEKEYIFQIRTRLNKMKNLLEEQEYLLSVEIFIRLFRKVLSGFAIPFEGEPLQGIQFMGILESRLLDFKNIIFLSMNEGVMPAAHQALSYIPANLRYAFQLPNKEDKDAIYAYYFYRLLQRAEKVHILYNNQTEGVKSGEPSRYIPQIEYLTHWQPEVSTRSFKVLEKEPVEIRIEKSPEVMEVLNKFRNKESRHYLSPSSLSNYLDCSLRFYFSYVAGMREEDEVTEEIDASGFGSLYHKTMELLYNDFRMRQVTVDQINRLVKSEAIGNYMDQAFREEFLKIEDPSIDIKPEGRNMIIYEIIRKMVLRTLENDKSFAPFTFIETEQIIDKIFLNAEHARDIHLGGKIDRLDRRNGSLYVLDYKTGKVNLKFPSLEEVFDRDSWSENANYKGIFQTFMYSWLFYRKHPEEKAIAPGIYSTRELFHEDFTVNIHDKSRKADVLKFSEYSQEFEGRLTNLLAEIFNPEIDFAQTDDENRCKYCVYREICHRG